MRCYRLVMKFAALTLLLGVSALADVASCRTAFDKETFDLAHKECSAAADQGSDDAQNVLAVMYVVGKGVPQDYTEATRRFRLAADQGNAFAQLNLGDVYALGLGITQDYVQAHMWYNLAAAAGLPEAVRGRDFVSKKMTQAQISEAQRLAREWKPKAGK
jgi:TPR repeat protein